MPKIAPFLWFDAPLEEPIAYYQAIFENFRLISKSSMSASFEIEGQRFNALNGGPKYRFNEAVSFMIDCDDQSEVDYYWERLTDGGEESQCGWLKDRYGLSWQVVPTGMEELFADPDPGRAQRAMQAMLGMRKLDVAALRAAADGVSST